jgi:hypothetical protein
VDGRARWRGGTEADSLPCVCSEFACCRPLLYHLPHRSRQSLRVRGAELHGCRDLRANCGARQIQKGNAERGAEHAAGWHGSTGRDERREGGSLWQCLCDEVTVSAPRFVVCRRVASSQEGQPQRGSDRGNTEGAQDRGERERGDEGNRETT